MASDAKGKTVLENVEKLQVSDDLLNVLSELDNPNDVRKLLDDLFTAREIRETSQRLEVARLLSEKQSYADIERMTGASATTIARVSKCLANGAGGYALALDIMNKKAGSQE